MSEVLQTNIFFFITGIAVIIFTLLLCILLYNLIRITTSVRKIMSRIEAGSESISEGLEQFKQYITERSPISTFLEILLRGRGSKADTTKRARTSRKVKKEDSISN